MYRVSCGTFSKAEFGVVAKDNSVAAPASSKTMTIIVSNGSLDGAYPPFIVATTAAAMGVDVTMFFTFYGLLLRNTDPQMTPLGNPAMKMPMMGVHIGLPSIIGAFPGVDAACTTMMKNLIKKKGFLRSASCATMQSTPT